MRVLTAGLSRWGAARRRGGGGADAGGRAHGRGGAGRRAGARRRRVDAAAGAVARRPRARARARPTRPTRACRRSMPVDVDVVTAYPENGDPNDFMARIVPSAARGAHRRTSISRSASSGRCSRRRRGDDVLAAAARRRRASSAAAVKAWEAQRASGAKLLVLLPFPIPGDAGVESMWIDVTRLDARTVTGKVMDDPLGATDVKRGDEVTRPRSEVEDVECGVAAEARSAAVTAGRPAELRPRRRRLLVGRAAMGAWWLVAAEKAPARRAPSARGRSADASRRCSTARRPSRPRDVLARGGGGAVPGARGRRDGRRGREEGRRDAHARAPRRAGARRWRWRAARSGLTTARRGGEDRPRRRRAAARRRAGWRGRARSRATGRWVFVVDVDAEPRGADARERRIARRGRGRRAEGAREVRAARCERRGRRRSVYWADRLDGSIVAVAQDGRRAAHPGRPTAASRARRGAG